MVELCLPNRKRTIEMPKRKLKEYGWDTTGLALLAHYEAKYKELEKNQRYTWHSVGSIVTSQRGGVCLRDPVSSSILEIEGLGRGG